MIPITFILHKVTTLLQEIWQWSLPSVAVFDENEEQYQ